MVAFRYFNIKPFRPEATLELWGRPGELTGQLRYLVGTWDSGLHGEWYFARQNPRQLCLYFHYVGEDASIRRFARMVEPPESRILISEECVYPVVMLWLHTERRPRPPPPRLPNTISETTDEETDDSSYTLEGSMRAFA